ncbi:MAG TPA: hypothetical protein VJT71_18865 [Pyrinomonadaceae bacterium]|nr:hypothetical protein [Pyrinomonadaceae bacterium]
MKHHKVFLSLMMAAALIALPLLTISASAQDPQVANQATALMRGYRTGYSDGFPAGRNDSSRQVDRDVRAKVEYQQADRAYLPAFGTLEEYRDGYQQGFEAGYSDGYDGKSFDSTIPTDLKRREQSDANNPQTDPNAPQLDPNPSPANNSGAGVSTIPRDTIIRVELLSNLSTTASQKGDRFDARVLEPKEYEGATIQGQVTSVKRPGKTKGTAELQLSFDEIRFGDGRSARMSAQVIEVLPNGASEGVGKVDTEGGVQGKDSTKSDVKKVGIAAGVGGLLGAIFGGGSGAAIGATIGAGVGTAGVLRERGKDIYLYRGQNLRIRTAGNAEVQ